jgi:hypothetical protein
MASGQASLCLSAKRREQKCRIGVLSATFCVLLREKVIRRQLSFKTISNFSTYYILSIRHPFRSDLREQLCYCEVRRSMKCSENRVKLSLAR